MDRGRGGGMKDGAVTAGKEALENDCAMVESKGRVEWLQKSWADDFHLEEDGWGDDESGSRAPMRVTTWKWEKVRAENGKTVIVEREGNWGCRRWIGCWEGQKCNKEQVEKCTSAHLSHSPITRTTLAWCSISGWSQTLFFYIQMMYRRTRMAGNCWTTNSDCTHWIRAMSHTFWTCRKALLEFLRTSGLVDGWPRGGNCGAKLEVTLLKSEMIVLARKKSRGEHRIWSNQSRRNKKASRQNYRWYGYTYLTMTLACKYAVLTQYFDTCSFIQLWHEPKVLFFLNLSRWLPLRCRWLCAAWHKFNLAKNQTFSAEGGAKLHCRLTLTRCNLESEKCVHANIFNKLKEEKNTVIDWIVWPCVWKVPPRGSCGLEWATQPKNSSHSCVLLCACS